MFNLIYAYNACGQMVPMKFFSINAACEALVTMGSGIISVIDDDNNFHHKIDASKGIFIYDDEQGGFVNYNPFAGDADVKNHCRRYGNDPGLIIDARKQQSLEDIIAQQVEEIQAQRRSGERYR